jgi:hypothetical protein
MSSATAAPRVLHGRALAAGAGAAAVSGVVWAEATPESASAKSADPAIERFMRTFWRERL